MSLQSNYGFKKYDITLRDQRALDGFSPAGDIASGALVFVYDAGTKTLSTIYSDGNATALANPISRSAFAALGKLQFFGAALTYDMTVAMDDGSIAKYAGVAPSIHVLEVNRDGVNKCMIVPFSANTSETDTTLDFPYNVHIEDVVVEVVTSESGKTLDVGLLSSESSGSANGLIAAISTTTAGFLKPYVNTAGGNETYVSTAKYGTLMGPVIVGTDVDKDNGMPRGFGHIVSGTNAKSLTYTSSSASASMAGYIYCFFRHLR